MDVIGDRPAMAFRGENSAHPDGTERLIEHDIRTAHFTGDTRVRQARRRVIAETPSREGYLHNFDAVDCDLSVRRCNHDNVIILLQARYHLGEETADTIPPRKEVIGSDEKTTAFPRRGRSLLAWLLLPLDILHLIPIDSHAPHHRTL